MSSQQPENLDGFVPVVEDWHAIVCVLGVSGPVLTYITVIGTGDWILTTLKLVNFCYTLECRGIVLAVVTGVRSSQTLLILVNSDATALKPLPTLVHALHCHKLAPIQLSSWRWILIQMFV